MQVYIVASVNLLTTHQLLPYCSTVPSSKELWNIKYNVEYSKRAALAHHTLASSIVGHCIFHPLLAEVDTFIRCSAMSIVPIEH